MVIISAICGTSILRDLQRETCQILFTKFLRQPGTLYCVLEAEENILVNNAGVQPWGPLLDLAEADWDRVIDTNLKGCFLCTQAAGRRMRSVEWRHHQYWFRQQQTSFPKPGFLHDQQGRN